MVYITILEKDEHDFLIYFGGNATLVTNMDEHPTSKVGTLKRRANKFSRSVQD